VQTTATALEDSHEPCRLSRTMRWKAFYFVLLSSVKVSSVVVSPEGSYREVGQRGPKCNDFGYWGWTNDVSMIQVTSTVILLGQNLVFLGRNASCQFIWLLHCTGEPENACPAIIMYCNYYCSWLVVVSFPEETAACSYLQILIRNSF